MTSPAPPVPADLDLYDMPDMPLDGARLRDSKLVLKASGEEFRAAVLLWGAAWRQIPASSLPDDEDELCAFAGLGRDLKRWRKVRGWALHGFIKCSDGRLYHPVIAEKAISAYEGRRREESNKAKTRRRVREWRAGQRGNVDETVTVTRDVTVTPPLPKRGSTTRREEKGREGNNAAADARVTALAAQVCDIAGADGTTHANWHMVESAVARWLAAGCTPDDIVAGVRTASAKRSAAGKGPPNSPAFFDGSVADAKAARSKPMPSGSSGATGQGVQRFDTSGAPPVERASARLWKASKDHRSEITRRAAWGDDDALDRWAEGELATLTAEGGDHATR